MYFHIYKNTVISQVGLGQVGESPPPPSGEILSPPLPPSQDSHPPFTNHLYFL